MSPIPCVAVELAKARHASRLRQANSCCRNFFQQQFSPSFAEPELHLLFGAMILNATPQVQHCKIPHLPSILLLLLLSHQATTISGRLSSALGPFANIFLLCLEPQTRVALSHLSCTHVIITTPDYPRMCKFMQILDLFDEHKQEITKFGHSHLHTLRCWAPLQSQPVPPEMQQQDCSNLRICESKGLIMLRALFVLTQGIQWYPLSKHCKHKGMSLSCPSLKLPRKWHTV